MSQHTADTSSRTSGTAARLVAAGAILVGGLVHLQLYFDGYRSLPDPNLGRSFVLNGVASIVVAALLVFGRETLIRVAGLAVTIGTLAAFVISRQGDGIFGLRENGLSPSPQALVALVAELVALGALLLTFLPAVGGGTVLPLRAATALAGAVAVVGIAGSALFANTATSAAAVEVPTTPGSVAIAGFAFDQPTTTVAAGTTITWTNADGFAHSVVARDDTFRSDNLATGATFSHTFDAAGTYAYICGIHPSMAGTVVVTG